MRNASKSWNWSGKRYRHIEEVGDPQDLASLFLKNNHADAPFLFKWSSKHVVAMMARAAPLLCRDRGVIRACPSLTFSALASPVAQGHFFPSSCTDKNATLLLRASRPPRLYLHRQDTPVEGNSWRWGTWTRNESILPARKDRTR